MLLPGHPQGRIALQNGPEVPSHVAPPPSSDGADSRSSRSASRHDGPRRVEPGPCGADQSCSSRLSGYCAGGTRGRRRWYPGGIEGPNSQDAWHSLRECGPAALPHLHRAFRCSTNTTMRSVLVELARQTRSSQALPFLAEALADGEPGVWKQALDGLVTLGGEPARCILRDAELGLLYPGPGRHLWAQRQPIGDTP